MRFREPLKAIKNKQLLILCISILVMCAHFWAPRVVLSIEGLPLVGSHECNLSVPAGDRDSEGVARRSQDQLDLISSTGEFFQRIIVLGLHQTREEMLRKLDDNFPGYYSANRETSGAFTLIAYGRFIPEAELLREWESQMVTTYSEYVCGELDQLPLGLCADSRSMCEDKSKRSLAVSATYRHISIGQVSFIFVFGLFVIVLLRKYVFSS